MREILAGEMLVRQLKERILIGYTTLGKRVVFQKGIVSLVLPRTRYSKT